MALRRIETWIAITRGPASNPSDLFNSARHFGHELHVYPFCRNRRRPPVVTRVLLSRRIEFGVRGSTRSSWAPRAPGDISRI